MKKTLVTLCQELEKSIQDAYEQGVDLQEAERLATKFLYANIQVSQALRNTDLDARMRKSGLKAIKSAVRIEEVGKFEKKPTEGALDDAVNLNEQVNSSQDALDSAEVDRDLLQNYFNVFREAHVHFRGIAKGKFE